MASATLTLIVPTYNRAGSLALLLRTLRDEMRGMEDQVDLLVSDNASTDGSAASLVALAAEWPHLRVRRNEQNLGADGNFLACMAAVNTRYCWFISDDDLPKPGVVRRILMLLKGTQPALVYMQSEWVSPLTSNTQGERVETITAQIMDGLSFVRRVHTWLTFISGIVFDRSALDTALHGDAIDRFTGTSLVQLGWVLPLLRLESARFVVVPERCILATKGNTGGYPLLTVFGTRLTQIAEAAFGPGSALSRALIRGNTLYYLPLLIWAARTSSVGRHRAEDPWPAMRQAMDSNALYWLLLVPLGRFPRWLATPVFQVWRTFFRLSRVLERTRWRGAHAVQHF